MANNDWYLNNVTETAKMDSPAELETPPEHTCDYCDDELIWKGWYWECIGCGRLFDQLMRKFKISYE